MCTQLHHVFRFGWFVRSYLLIYAFIMLVTASKGYKTSFRPRNQRCDGSRLSRLQLHCLITPYPSQIIHVSTQSLTFPYVLSASNSLSLHHSKLWQIQYSSPYFPFPPPWNLPNHPSYPDLIGKSGYIAWTRILWILFVRIFRNL